MSNSAEESISCLEEQVVLDLEVVHMVVDHMVVGIHMAALDPVDVVVDIRRVVDLVEVVVDCRKVDLHVVVRFPLRIPVPMVLRLQVVGLLLRLQALASSCKVLIDYWIAQNLKCLRCLVA